MTERGDRDYVSGMTVTGLQEIHMGAQILEARHLVPGDIVAWEGGQNTVNIATHSGTVVIFQLTGETGYTQEVRVPQSAQVRLLEGAPRRDH